MKKSVKKLTPKEIETFKNELLSERSRLRGDVSSMTKSATKNNKHDDNTTSESHLPLHPADAGTDSFEQEFTFSLLQSGSNRIIEIEEALARIASGSYGICETCDSVIAKERLSAIPYAAQCIKCATAKSSSR